MARNRDSDFGLEEDRITRRRMLARLGALAGLMTLESLIEEFHPLMRGEALKTAFAETAPRAGGTLTIAQTTLADSLDPGTAAGWSSWKTYDNIFNKLINMDENGQFVPELATSWKSVDDVTWEFTLVRNAVFHNGEKLTAGDVKFTFDRILDPKTGSVWAGMLEPIASVETSGDYKVVIRLKRPYGPFLSYVAYKGQIVNEKAIREKDPKRNPIGTGPFKFVEWISQDHITLEKWDQYFKKGLPYLDRVVIRDYPVDITRVVGLQKNEIQWADAVPLSEVERLKRSDVIKLVATNKWALSDHIALNASKAPLNNKKVRQAIAWAVDRKAMARAAFFGQGEFAAGVFPSGSPWYEGVDLYAGAPNLTKAKQLLTEAGYPQGLEIEVVSLTQFAELARMAEVLREQLKPIGIRVKLVPVELVDWQQRVFIKGTYSATTTYSDIGPDPDNYLFNIFHSKNPRNYFGYGNPKVDTLLERGRFTFDPAKRRAIYAEVAKIIADDAAAVFVHFTFLIWAMRKEVMGSKVYPDLDFRFENFWFAK